MVNAQPLSGNYTINSMMVTGGTNFASFNDFASALTANGISADVTATVEPGSGPYPESVIFQNISGLSATAGITIEGNAEIITAVTNSTDRHVVRLTDMRAYEFIANDINSTPSGFGLNVFPNPVMDKLNIEFPNTNEQVNAIKIYGMDGKLVRFT